MFRCVIILSLVLYSTLGSDLVFAQEIQDSNWEITPSLLLTTYFPSASVTGMNTWGYNSEYIFEGMGLNIQVRGFYSQLPDVAFTFSGGINWFGNIARQPVYAELSSGVGAILGYQSFRTFPITFGLEYILPRSIKRSVMFFFGGNVGVHFVDGNLDMSQQAKFGYSLGGGFAVKMFEFGVRYYSFSDIRNIGASVGVRFDSFKFRSESESSKD